MKERKRANKKLIAVLASMFVMVICFAAIGAIRSKAAGNLIVHFQTTEGTPNIYYWNTDGSGDNPVSWPGVAMTAESDGWYKYTIGATSSNLIFNIGSWQTGDLYRSEGEWWYIDGEWTDVDPNATVEVNASDKVELHFKSSWGAANVYYWNLNGAKNNDVSWPGATMTSEGNDWYTYTISASSANVIFTNAGGSQQTGDLYREAGAWWYYNNTWYDENPEEETPTVSEEPVASETPVTTDSIVVHYYSTTGGANVYYWNPNGTDTKPVTWPGVSMTSEGSSWYTYTFSNTTSVNLIFNYNGSQTADLSRTTGDWWYKNSKWYPSKQEAEAGTTTSTAPATTSSSSGGTSVVSPVKNVEDREDFRDETIYFLMTTRFYDGDSSNNIHCWDDTKAGNPDSDPAWRGDFKGLIKKLDYIKALGFTAVWITPVVQNSSGYDYHGYHALNFSVVDPRYESVDTDYQDLIDACHDKDIKIIQDIVLNHTGNFGEVNLFPLFDKDPSVSDESAESLVKIDSKGVLPSNYDSLTPDAQYSARINAMKEDTNDTENIYHHEKTLSWEGYTVQTGQIAGDCVDLNTENKAVANYLIDCYTKYINMGVDSFRIDTLKHISRLTMNQEYVPAFTEAGGSSFFMFGEVCSRYRQVWNSGIPAISAPFFTWCETKSYSWGDVATNLNSVAQHWADNCTTANQPTSSNAFLNGNEYHSVDTSRESNCWVIDFPMHWNFNNAYDAFNVALDGDKYYSDATYNVVYVDSHDYAPDCAPENQRFAGSQDTWAENLNLMFTFRGIPCIYYGSEIEFQKGKSIDVGPNAPLSTTGRAYFGDYLEGTVTADGFCSYNASGTVADTLKHPLSLHIQRLNLIRASVPALRKGQYSTSDISGSGMSYKRRYTNGSEGIDSFALVNVSGSATFSNIPNGTYVEVVTGQRVSVTGGSLTTASVGKGNMRVYVLDNGKNGTALGKIGADGTYLK